MKVKACIMRCKKCRKWTAYKSSKGGVERIDTICKVCGARIRHTHRFKPYTMFQGVKLYYGIGKGGYQRFSSIIDIIVCNNENPNVLASFMNQQEQKRKARMMGFDLDKLEYIEVAEELEKKPEI